MIISHTQSILTLSKLFLKDFIEKLRQAWWNISIHIIQYNI